jgi:peptide/nickel transport system substrate-binding protein
MEEAGWTVEDGVMTGPDGEPFTFEILLQRARPRTSPSSTSMSRRWNGWGSRPVTVDPTAQYRERTTPSIST